MRAISGCAAKPSVRSFVTVRTMSGAPAASESRRRNPAWAAAPGAERGEDFRAIDQACLDSRYFFGERHQFDHALVGLARALAEGEDPVIEQDHSHRLGRALALEFPRAILGEIEARHEVRN